MSKKNSVNINQIDVYEQKKEVLTSFFSDNSNDKYSAKKLMAKLKIAKKYERLIEEILSDLESEGKIYNDGFNYFTSTKNPRFVKCTFQAKNEYFAFAINDNGQDIHISSMWFNNAMHSDYVLVEIMEENSLAKPEGRVVKILKHNLTSIVGIYNKSKKCGVVCPMHSYLQNVYVYKEEYKNIENGSVVKVDIVKYPKGNGKCVGQNLRLVAKSKEKCLYTKWLYADYNLDEIKNFSEDIKNELLKIPDKVSKVEKEGRVDRTKARAYTIDSADAMDLDDAVFVKKTKSGNYMLSVYIADVSHYVKEGTFLDKEAVNRGTSIYIPGEVIPMLPKKLSNGICSLNAGEERLSLAVDVTISNTGEVIKSHVFKAVICVTKKMSYDKVYKVITDTEDESTKTEYSPYKSDLKLMQELAIILNNKRIKEGCINFDVPETHIVLNKEGLPSKIEPYNTTFANQIVEEFMLVANMTVAKKFYNLKMPFIYRVHDKPDDEKLKNLNDVLESYNLKIKNTKNISSKTLADILNKINEGQDIVATYMLRAQMLAKYSSKCTGHFGLNAKYYCHFTSPIRRYPDLFIHRMISRYLDDGSMNLTPKEKAKYERKARKYAKTSSEMEKNATKIERDFDDLYCALYMKNEAKNTIYNAKVTSLTSFGMFIRLENTIEGFVGFSLLKSDYFEYYEKEHIIIGKRTGKTYKIGDELKVSLVTCDVMTRQIDFKVVE